ncbi:MAG: HYR domain-containing protein, partial [Polyangiaceae bacterium]
GANKNRWIECSQMTLNPSQKLTAHLEAVGTKVFIENDGPPTSCDARLQNLDSGQTISLGLLAIPPGTSQLSTVAPVTTPAVTGGTLGQNGWYVTPPTVTLNVQDTSGQGIAAIEYSFDQTNWTPYTAPFTYTQEGTTTLYYRARDNAQNQEGTRSQEFKLDTQLPTTTGTVGTSGGVTLNYTATDPTPGSGVAGVHATVRDANGTPSTSFYPGTSGALTLATTCSAVEYWSQDVAGNQQSPHVIAGDTVAPTFLSVPAAVQSTKCTAAAGLSIGTATASDNCGTVTVTNDAPATFPIGKTTVTWTARDAAGNTTTATQLVTTTLLDSASCCPAGTNVIMGTAGADTILGTAGNDCILGLGGNDTISSQGGNDYISGGPGNDTIAAGAGNDWVWAGDGNDTIDGSTGDDFINGGTGTNTCSGGAGINAITSCTTTAGCTAACCSTNTCGP